MTERYRPNKNGTGYLGTSDRYWGWLYAVLTTITTAVITTATITTATITSLLRTAGAYSFDPGGATTVAADVLAIPVTHSHVTKTTGAIAEALTLANGTKGQELTIVLGTDGGGDGTLTPTTKTGWATIVFADAGDQVSLRYIDDTVGWIIKGSFGLLAQPTIT
ncbi:MAG: hypothetical protein KKC03_13625 [Bacteroidetes bacterium]|nr:hypothetical protein [Bacteroidota bacterium]